MKLMSTVKIPFSTQETGYNQSQVDKYIQKLTSEYGSLQQKYNELSARSEQVVQSPDESMKAIAKALVDAEIKGIQIITEAKSEAARIVGNAYEELEQVKERKDRTLIEIKELLNGLKEIMPSGDALQETDNLGGAKIYSERRPFPEIELEEPGKPVYSEKEVFPDRRVFPEPEMVFADI